MFFKKNSSILSDGYRADIDGLRAVAVLMVLVFHFKLVPGADIGFSGVDMFFVVSGYLITKIIFNDLESGVFVFRDFYLRRVRRLAPALFVSLLFSALVGALFLFPIRFMELSRQIFSAQFYVSNFYFWKNVNYFGLSAQDAPLLHTWSLSVEEQFYLVYPVILFLIHRYFRDIFWRVLASFCGISLVLSILLSGVKPEFSFYLLPTRAWELILGAVLVPMTTHVQRLKPKTGSKSYVACILLCSFFLLFFEAYFYKPGIPLPGVFALIPSSAAAGFIIAGAFKNNERSFLSNVPLVALGRVSYPLYLIHWPVNVFAAMMLKEGYTLPFRFLFFFASIFLSALIWRFIEEPIRRARVLKSAKKLLCAYGVGLGLTLVFFYSIIYSQGLPGRFHEDVVRMAEFENDRVLPLSECQFDVVNNFHGGLTCIVGASGVTPTWLVIGDSHAWAAHDAFDQWLKAKGVAARYAFRHSCPPIQGISLIGDNGLCSKFNNDAREFLKNNPLIKDVVLVSTWRQFIEGRVLDSGSGKILNPNVEYPEFNQIFSQNVRWFQANCKRIHIWAPVPGASAPVPESLAQAMVGGQAKDLQISVKDYESDYKFLFDSIKENSGSIEDVYLPSKRLCRFGKCDVLFENIPLYFDNAHMTKSSWPLWVEVLDDPVKKIDEFVH